MTAPRPVVLIHGAAHGAWCWAALQASLDRLGVPSYALDLPGHGASTAMPSDLHGDAAAVEAVLDKLDDEVVLVGHSYGGAVIGQAGLAGRVAHLVFVAALVLDVGENASGLMAGFPASEPPVPRVFDRGDDGLLRVRSDPAIAGVFYNTSPPELAAAAIARLSPQRAATLRQAATNAAWRTIPSTYVRCLQDRAVPVAAQDLLAARLGPNGMVATLDTDHSPFLCQPDALAAILAPLAARHA